MSFQHGLSGLNAAARNLDVIGNNVANANTVGAKSSRAEFADLYANSLTGLSTMGTGIGVAVTSVAQQFTQGDIVSTQNPLDMAINGRGFFRTSMDGATQYTRNGQFRMDKDGYIVTAQGARLTGFPVDDRGQVANGTPSELRISTADMSPKPTDTAGAQLNLDATSTVSTSPFSPTTVGSFASAMTMSVYDSLGRDHDVTLYFRKTAENAWQLRASVDGTVLPDTGAGSFAPTMSFGTDGKLTSAANALQLPVIGAGGPAAAQTVSVDLSRVTQFGAPFATNEITQNGYGTGRLSGFTADETGMLVGRYSNGQTRPQGQIVLANFVNPQGLVPIGNNAWVESGAAGQPTIGSPGSGILGSLEAAAVENSNVDLTAELVSMITAQRTYQANAQTIKTHDQLLQTIVNLR
jgi:flagellar hook protein FlgE